MAFTPVTIPAGSVLATNASNQGVQDNLDKMKNYIDGGVAPADLAADSLWVMVQLPAVHQPNLKRYRLQTPLLISF